MTMDAETIFIDTNILVYATARRMGEAERNPSTHIEAECNASTPWMEINNSLPRNHGRLSS